MPSSAIFASSASYKSLTGSRRCVTSVQEAVYIYLLHALSLCQLEQTVQMCDVAVYAAIRKKSVTDAERNRSPLHWRLPLKQCLIAEEIAILDLFGNTCQLLVYNAAGTHI